jgi:superfamily I DNA/RNA helicase
MLQRTRALLAGSVAEEMRVVGGTFHSVAYRLLRLHAGSLGLPAGFSVLDPSDAADLIDVAREELGFASRRRRFPRKATLADILFADGERAAALVGGAGRVVSVVFGVCGGDRGDLPAVR